MDNPVVMVAIIGVLGSVIGGVIVYLGNKNYNKAKTIDLSADTYLKLSNRIDQLEVRDAAKEERIDWLEKELRRYINGYTLAIKFIHFNLPAIEIPNFLETDPRIKTSK